MLIIAHRGASALRPENTLSAFDLAVNEFKVPMMEFDVRLSRDQIPVILHDAKVDRTTNGSGYVSHFSLKDLKKLDAGFHFRPEQCTDFPYRNKGITIPTLEEVLSRYPDTELCVEIKDNSLELVHQVTSLIEKYGATDRCIVGSKHHPIARELRTKFPQLKHFYSQKEIVLAYLEFQAGKSGKKDPLGVASMPLERCHLHFDAPEFIQSMHEKEVRIFFWTVNHSETMKALQDKGADGIITDDPGLAWKIIGSGTDPASV